MSHVLISVLMVGAASLLDAAQDGFVAPAACKKCHARIYESYLRTGMGRSFSSAVVSEGKGSYYHRASNRYYNIARRNGSYYLRRHQLDSGGAEINVLEKSIDAVVGSGSHARSYLHRSGSGKLLELLLSWYAEGGGHWGMSPGFDRPDHADFRREISKDCLFCHNGYPAVADGGMPQGIDCQRCHGPGRHHVSTPARTTIVNPARLSAERQMEVCMQCHLQTTSRALPHALRRYGRAPYSYRPGEPLGEYMIHFDHARGSGYEDKFEVNSAAYRLRKSKCFAMSAGRMTCTTCHDPHGAPPDHRGACQMCHSSAHASEVSDCIGCHMPKRRTEDAVHVMITDHLIQRKLKPASAENHEETQNAYSGEVELYYPPAAAGEILYLAGAQVKDGANLQAGVARLERAIAELKPSRPEFYFEVAAAYRKAGWYDNAVEAYRQTIARDPEFARAWHFLGESLLRAGRSGEAIAALEAAAKLAVLDAEILNSLGVAYGQGGRSDDSVRILTKAVQSDPDLPLAWVNLGVSLEHKGDLRGARAAYRNAIRVQPDLASAREHLANAEQGNK